MALSNYLKTLQKQAGISLVEWSVQSKVSRTSLWRWLSGKSLPRDTELESALAVLGADAAVRARAFGLLEAARGGGVLKLGVQTGLPLLDRSHLLAALRERAGLTQSAAAQHTGIARPSLHHWESGVAWPSADRLHTLCFHYGVTQDEFLALTLPSRTAGEYLDAPLDLDQMRVMLDDLALWQISPIPGMLIAQRLSFLAPSNREARSLLCRMYAHLGNLEIDVQSRRRTQHFLGLAQQLATDPVNLAQIAIAQNHFVREPLKRGFYETPAELAHLKAQRPILGKQAYAYLGQVADVIDQAPLPLQVRWYTDRSVTAGWMGRREEALALIEKASTLAEALGERFVFQHSMERMSSLTYIEEHEQIVQDSLKVHFPERERHAVLLYLRARALHASGAITEARSQAEAALALATGKLVLRLELLLRKIDQKSCAV